MMRLHIALAAALMLACTGNKAAPEETAAERQGPDFNADSAYVYCEGQCSFGPRTMNSTAHDDCGAWIAATFRRFGCEVTRQETTLKAYDGAQLRATNIIASYRPENADRIMLCAHWDSRPWADNGPETQWQQPVMGANDGASGVAVMMEVARLLCQDSLAVGVDFVCFDAEDYGMPQWEGSDNDSWALGAQHWAANPHTDNYNPRFAILLDMVGGEGARFYREGFSMQLAPQVVSRVWKAARTAGYATRFVNTTGGYVTDDHLPLNTIAGIAAIDIIAYYPDCPDSSFGPTWHTTDDTMEHIDRTTLKAVGQTVIQVLYETE